MIQYIMLKVRESIAWAIPDSIYEGFGLEFTNKAEAVILNTSGVHNPIEHKRGKELFRNSKKNIYNWKNLLSQNEIELIKIKTSEISALFYSDDEW